VKIYSEGGQNKKRASVRSILGILEKNVVVRL
jgi:hypothetical protein